MSDTVLTVTDESFAEVVLDNAGPVLVDFWAPWCGPCKQLAPVLDEIASECRGKVTIVKLDIVENPDVAKRFQVMSLPTMVVFRNGEVVQRIFGARDKTALVHELGAVLS